MAVSMSSSPVNAATNTNPAKEARHLLDIVSQVGTIASALTEIVDRQSNNLPKYVAKNLQILVKALLCVHQESRYQVARVSSVSNILQGYNMVTKVDREAEIVHPNHVTMTDSMWKSMKFVEMCSKGCYMSANMVPLSNKMLVKSEKR